MAINTTPVFTRVPKVNFGTCVTQNTLLDGTGTSVLVFTAHATDSSEVYEIRAKPMGSIATATVLRLFINNGATAGTASNNILIKEAEFPVKTQDQVSANDEFVFNFQDGDPNGFLRLPATYRIYATISQNVTDGIGVSVYGADYTAA